MKKYYYNLRKKGKKRWYKQEYLDNFVKVNVLGETFYPINSLDSNSNKKQYFLIELPDKTHKEIPYYDLFTELKKES